MAKNVLLSLGLIAAVAFRANAWEARSPVGSTTTAAAVMPGGDVIALELEGGGASSLARFDGVTGALVWRVPTVEHGGAQLAVDPAGNAVTVGGDDECLVVVEHAAADGSETWRYTDGIGCAGPGAGTGIGLAIDAAGDVVATGFAPVGGFALVKLDGTNGSLLWRKSLGPGDGSVALYPNGDGVVLDGVVVSSQERNRVRNFTSAGGDGWTYTPVVPTDSCTQYVDAAVGAGTDVFVVLTGCRPGPERYIRVERLVGATGLRTWAYDDPRESALDEATTLGYDIAVSPAGLVLVGGKIEGAATLLAIDSASGALAWEWSSGNAGKATDDFGILDIAVDSSGDPVAIGGISRGRDVDVAVLAFDAGDGAVRWERRLVGGASSERTVAVDASDDVVVGYDRGVVKLRGADGVTFVGSRCGTAVCGPCDVCLGPNTCGPGVRFDCRTPQTPTGSALDLKRGPTPSSDRVSWRWGDGSSSLAADLGDPANTTDETLCVYEDVGGAPSLVWSDTVGALASCRTKPCWKASGTAVAPSFGYKSLLVSPAGKTTTQVKLSAGPGRKTSSQWNGKGPALALPTLGLTLPVRVELRSTTGMCWAASYDAGVTRNDASQLKAKGGS